MDGIADIFAGLSVSPGVTAIIAAGMLLAAPTFARWLTNTVATFFDDYDAECEAAAFYEGGGWDCCYCGEPQDCEAGSHEYEEGMDMCDACAKDDSRWA